jgi:hypothetical protein
MTGNFYEDQHIYIYIYLITSRLIPLRIRNVSEKKCIENRNKHFIFNNFFNCAFYEIMWENIA